MRKTLFLKNAAIVTVNTLLLRLAGVIFRVWTAAKIGSEGMGIYQLTLSVYILCSTFASTGIQTTVTRLVSDKEALSDSAGGRAYTKKAILLCMLVCSVFIPTLFFGADFISNVLLCEARTVSSVRLCGFALPFVSLCACFKGYFLAKRQTVVPCLSQLIEQAVRILTVVFLIDKAANISQKITALILGDIAAEAVASLFLFFFWVKGKRQKSKPASIRKILRIALPISGGKYINSLLRTVENILVPAKLALFYASKSKALSAIGVIKGMALPILLFPYTLLSATTSLLLPEISADAAQHHTRHIAYTIHRAFKLTLIFSFCCSTVFLFAGDQLGQLMYKNAHAGQIIKILAPLVPLMYIDSISDAILKSLDMQLTTFKNSVSDSIIRLVLVYFCLSAGGINAFIIIMYFSNLYTSLINFYKMYKVTHFNTDIINTLVLPLIFALFAGFTASNIMNRFNLSGVLYVCLTIATIILIYSFLLFVFGVVKREEIKMR